MGARLGRAYTSDVYRKREIDAFVPEEYWNLKALYKHGRVEECVEGNRGRRG